MAYGGWTGKILRVDLSTRAITTEDTMKYKDYLGGTGFGWKVLWDECPAGTKALSPENRIIFGVGPTTGSGGPLQGRMVVTSLSNYPTYMELPVAGHGGGNWGPELKYAGWDSIIVQGKAATPVWIRIEDDKVSIEDASALWGNGTYHTQAEIATIMGSDCQVACIGQAGENMQRLSCIINSHHHSAGAGLGAVCGYKNLKAIGVRGTGSVKIAADVKTWKALNYKWLSYIGSNNNHSCPATKQPWAEYSSGTSRWTADKGVFWGAANPPVETGFCTDFEHPLPVDCPSPQNKMGRRCHKGYKDFGIPGANHTVKMNGCHSCPVRCHISTDVPQLEQYNVSRYNENTCTGNSILTSIMGKSNIALGADYGIIVSQLSTNLCDDYGFWHDYSQWSNCYNWALTHKMTLAECTALGLPASYAGKTTFSNRLPAAELTILAGASGDSSAAAGTSIWGRMAAGDPTAQLDIMRIICPTVAIANGIAKACPVFQDVVANGPAYWASQWPEIGYYCNSNNGSSCFKMYHAKHHGVENYGQLGFTGNFQFNRDPMNHTISNLVCFPTSLINNNMKQLFSSPTAPSLFNDPAGSDIMFVANEAGYHPVTNGMMAISAASWIEIELKNCMISCDWTLPVWLSPLKSRGYLGDINMHVDLYNAVTGDNMTLKQFQTMGLRIVTLFRCLTARMMNYYVANPTTITGRTRSYTGNCLINPAKLSMRDDHDYGHDWHYDKVGDATTGPVRGPGTGIPNSVSGNTTAYAANAVPFGAPGTTGGGTQIMDRADIETAKDLLYAQLGWDKATGMPTSATLTALGLSFVAADAGMKGLLP